LRGLGGAAARKTKATAEGAQNGVSPSDQEAILPAEGVEVFRRLLSRFVPPAIIVSTADLGIRIQQARAATSTAAADRLDKKTQKAKPVHPRSFFFNDTATTENDLEQDTANAWQAV